jgi:Co/Zn/Cd efflux system component
MEHCCETEHAFDGTSAAYKRVLWVVIVLNGAMFLVETGAGVLAKSMALRADALDFLGDSVTYAISLMVIGAALRWRARAAMFKGLSPGVVGLWVFGATLYHTLVTGQPEPVTMGLIGTLALVVNVASAALLYRFRDGDSNVRSVWLCSRNDAIGNVAVLVAAVLVKLTATPWPDLIVAAGMAALFLKGSIAIVRHARADLARAAA